MTHRGHSHMGPLLPAAGRLGTPLCTPPPTIPTQPSHPGWSSIMTSGTSLSLLWGCHHHGDVTIAQCPARSSITGEVLGATCMGCLPLLPSCVTVPTSSGTPHPAPASRGAIAQGWCHGGPCGEPELPEGPGTRTATSLRTRPCRSCLPQAGTSPGAVWSLAS